MPTDTHDLSILADCPELLAELGWVPNSDDPDAEYTKADKHGMVYRTLSEATASDRREAIGLLVERLGKPRLALCPPLAYGKMWVVVDLCTGSEVATNPDPLHALHAAYVAQKGQ